MHHIIQHFLDNKEALNASYVIESFCATVERNPLLSTMPEDSRYQEFKRMITHHKPYAALLSHAQEFTYEELSLVIDSMVSGWARAKLMEIWENFKH